MRHLRTFTMFSALSAAMLLGACSESALDPPMEADAGADTGPSADTGPAPLAVSCMTDTDCDDGVKCTTEICRQDNHECLRVADRGMCEKGQVCLPGTHVGEGGCMAPPPPPPMCPASCDDGVPCTVDTCNAAYACVHQTNSSTCGPSQTCDAKKGCVDPAPPPMCPPSCDDGNPCTVDTCGSDLKCKHQADSSKCAAGQVCNPTMGCMNPPPPPVPPAPTNTIECAADGTVTIYGPVSTGLIGGAPMSPTAIYYGVDNVMDGWTVPYPAGDTRAQAPWTNDVGPYKLKVTGNGFNFYVGGRWFDYKKWATKGTCHWGDGKTTTNDTKIYR